jgi:hypothetical protein
MHASSGLRLRLLDDDWCRRCLRHRDGVVLGVDLHGELRLLALVERAQQDGVRGRTRLQQLLQAHLATEDV